MVGEGGGEFEFSSFRMLLGESYPKVICVFILSAALGLLDRTGCRSNK